MPVYSLRQKANPGNPINWRLWGGGSLAAVGVVLAGLGVARKDPVSAVSGVGMAGGGGYLLYQELKPKKTIISVAVKPEELHPAITIDGELVGDAPVDWEVDPGEHTLSFEAVEGYITPEDETITVEEGQTQEIIARYQPEVPERMFEITSDRYQSPAGVGDWKET